VHNRGVEMRLRGLPEEIGRRLKVWAAYKGKNLNDLVIEILTQAVKERGPEIKPPKD
jgi:plasmid stability protein